MNAISNIASTVTALPYRKIGGGLAATASVVSALGSAVLVSNSIQIARMPSSFFDNDEIAQELLCLFPAALGAILGTISLMTGYVAYKTFQGDNSSSPQPPGGV